MLRGALPLFLAPLAGLLLFGVIAQPAMTFESAFGSLKPLQRPASFKQLRDPAVEEQVRNSTSKRK